MGPIGVAQHLVDFLPHRGEKVSNQSLLPNLEVLAFYQSLCLHRHDGK